MRAILGAGGVDSVAAAMVLHSQTKAWFPPRMRPTRVFSSLAFVALTLGASYAHADARSEARGHFNRGMQAIAEKRYAEGIAELEQAYEILPHPNVLYNIGRAKIQAGDLRGAVVDLRHYRDQNPADRDEVDRTLAELEEQIAKEDAQKAANQASPVKEPPPKIPQANPSDDVGPKGHAGDPPCETKPCPQAHSDETRIALPGQNPNDKTIPSQGTEAPLLKTDAVFDETVVTAANKAQSPIDAPNSTSIITQQDIKLSGITKIPELLRRLAGIDIMQVTGGQTEISIRGFNQRLSNKVLVLVDGRSVYADFIGATFWQALSIGVEDIKQIEVVRGPGSALYGGVAFNGVINLLTKTAEDGKGGIVAGVGELGQTHGSLWATGNDAGFGWRASAGYDYLPRWSREVPDGRTDVVLGAKDQNSSARTSRIDFRTTRELGKDNKLSIGGGLAQGSLESLGLGTLNDIVLPRFLSSDVTTQFTSKFIEARAYYNRFETETAQNASSVGQSLLPTRANQNILNIDGAFRVPFNTGKTVVHKLTAGGQYRYKNVDWTFLDRRRVENHGSFFIQDDVRFGKKAALIVDYRFDYIPYLSDFVQSPRAAFLFHPSAKSTIRASVASAFRPPTFLESYLHIPFQLPVTGGALLSEGIRSDDPSFRLKPEQTLSAELGYLNQDSDIFVLDTSVYVNRVSNLIQLADSRAVTLGDLNRGGQLDPESGLFPVFFGGFNNQCQKYNVVGGEVGARVFPAQGLDFYANYTLNLVGNDTSGCSVAAQSSLVEDQRNSVHKLNAGVQVRTKVGLEGSLDFHVVSKQIWAERVVDTVEQRIATTAFPLAAYSILNGRLGYKFAKERAEVSTQVFNILDIQHREHPFGQLVRRRMMAFVSLKF